MKTVLVSAALFLAGALAQSLTINTPSSVVACQPVLVTWVGGTAPYYLPGDNPNGAALVNLGQTNATSVTWKANLPSGTRIVFQLTDSTGRIAQTAPDTVQPGSGTCSNTTSVVPGPTASSTSATQTSSMSAFSTDTASSSSPSATAGKSGASTNVAQFGAAGIVGAAVAALFI